MTSSSSCLVPACTCFAAGGLPAAGLPPDQVAAALGNMSRIFQAGGFQAVPGMMPGVPLLADCAWLPADSALFAPALPQSLSECLCLVCALWLCL